ncbi:ectoine hydroxylase [Paraperlucidibaca baekdonensis]|uniref:Ectoine hydroxylase n=1 Tax=Paraperlucidibaca baekdonensis TaxID=748120 RepID=A0A3E0H999_9GAMM|nr:phytanoyl-CoA dioxygenase family protein [Paraperlucidibaca baekdonensis]REH40275.1 ectoine hydroxylase [Paraperlucidibaca baekdonensis]
MLSLCGDPYPSRELNEHLLARRREPVVWSEPALRPEWLSAEAEARYIEQGFLVVPDVLSADEIAELNAAMATLRDELTSSDSALVLREPGSDDMLSFLDLPSASPLFARLARHPKLLAFARYVLGSEVYLHQSRLNYRAADTQEEFYWHSDFETWHTEDGMPAMRALSCSVLLTDNLAEHAPKLLIPGSHKTYVGCVDPASCPVTEDEAAHESHTMGQPSPEILSLLTHQAGDVTSATGLAGSVVFFDSNIQHRSADEPSEHSRANAFLVYNSVDNMLGEPANGLAPRPEHLAHRDNVDVLAPLD